MVDGRANVKTLVAALKPASCLYLRANLDLSKLPKVAQIVTSESNKKIVRFAPILDAFCAEDDRY
jgi:hypothetical protein